MLPENWNGIFYDKESSGDLLFDLDPSAFADFLNEQEPDQAPSLMANAAFDLMWNDDLERSLAFSKEGKARWPDKPFGLEAVVVMVTREMMKSGCDKKVAALGALNAMGVLFGGLRVYSVVGGCEPA